MTGTLGILDLMSGGPKSAGGWTSHAGRCVPSGQPGTATGGIAGIGDAPWEEGAGAPG